MTRLPVTDGVRYVLRDNGAGTPIVLLHGFTGNGGAWATWLPDLWPDGRTVAVDLLGHGDSDSPPPERQSVERQAADLAAIMHQLGASPAHVLGYSFGARVALQMALDSPASVRTLILESPSAGIADPAARAARREEDGRWVRQLERGDLDAFVRDWAAQPIFASQARLPAQVRDRLVAERAANRPEGLAASLLGAGQGVMPPLHSRLGEIGVPTLVISGRLDPRGSARAGEVAEGIRGARHESVEDAGHTPHLEMPMAFRYLVTSFLAASVAAPSPTHTP